MVIDTRKNILKHNLKQTEINNKEKKLILLLSDNKYHSIGEIKKYTGIVFKTNVKVLIDKLNWRLKYHWRIKFISKQKNIDRYKITGNVYITY